MFTEDLSRRAGIALSTDALSEQWSIDHYEMSSSTFMKSVRWIVPMRVYSSNFLNLPAKFVQCNFLRLLFFLRLIDHSFTFSDSSVDSTTQYNLTVIIFIYSFDGKSCSHIPARAVPIEPLYTVSTYTPLRTGLSADDHIECVRIDPFPRAAPTPPLLSLLGLFG